MNNKIILLAEDNPDDEVLILRALGAANVANEVIVVHDGAEALDFLFGRGDHAGRDTAMMPVVVLLDINLPKLNGLEVLQRIRSDDRTKYLPVVILTSSKEENSIVESYRLGVNSYIRKPGDFDQFLEAIRLVGLYWLVLNQPLLHR